MIENSKIKKKYKKIQYDPSKANNSADQKLQINNKTKNTPEIYKLLEKYPTITDENTIKDRSHSKYIFDLKLKTKKPIFFKV